jgi:hypothetical protein
MTGSKPKVPSAASERKKMKQAEAEAKKCKNQEASDAAPPQKWLKTKPSKASRRAQAPTASSVPVEPLLVEPISVALPTSFNRERRLVVMSLLPQRLMSLKRYQPLTPS